MKLSELLFFKSSIMQCSFCSKVVTHDHDDEVDQSVAESTGKKSSRRKPAYAGGLVLEPKKGKICYIAYTLSLRNV